MDVRKRVGVNLKQLRQESGLSQEELVKLTWARQPKLRARADYAAVVTITIQPSPDCGKFGVYFWR